MNKFLTSSNCKFFLFSAWHIICHYLKTLIKNFKPTKMKKKWIVIVAGGFLLAACGDNSPETTYNDKTTETSPTTNTNPTTVILEYNPPDNVKAAFQTKYPNASDVRWSAYKPYDRINWEWT